MATRVFFSWQSDIPNSVGRNFLKQVLEEVCAELTAASELEEAPRYFELDSDTQNVAGHPPVTDTILKKIDEAAVVVSDMTLTGKRIDGRLSPNPNVLIEYGWALKSLGYSRVLCVMNTAFGEPSPQTLPFDLAHLRFPLQYSLPDGVTPEIKAAEKKKLKAMLRAAIQACIATMPAPAVQAPPAFPAAAAKHGLARFRGPGETIGLGSGSHRDL